jgi:transketolase
VIAAAKETGGILTVEEHNVLGGLGDAVASVLAEEGIGCAFRKHGLQDCFSVIGYAEDLYAHYGLDANGIADQVRRMMGIEPNDDDDWEDE